MPATASSPEASPRLRRELAVFSRVLGSGAWVFIVLLFATLLGVAPASAHWLAFGTGSTTASVATLLPPTNVSVPAISNSSVGVSWTAPTGSVVPTGYYVTRITGSAAVAACGSSPAALVAATSCTDTSVPEGTHKYQVTAVYRSWSAASAPSGNVTVASLQGLFFTSQPSSVLVAGTAIPAFTVQARTLGILPNLLGGAPVTISIGSNPGGGTLAGPTVTVETDVWGNATFTGLSIDKAGSGYTLIASSPSYAGAVSNSFTVMPAPATKLVVTSGATLAGPASSAALLGPVTLERQDSYGNPVTTGTTSVTLSSTAATTGTFAATANGTRITGVTIPAGSATSSFFYGDTAAGTPTITVATPGLTAPQPIKVTISAAPAGKLSFDPIPTVVPKNPSNMPPVKVRILDAFGNLTDSTALVTLQSNCSIKHTGSGPITATAYAGIATFPDLQIAGNASGCILTASSGTLAGAQSNEFNTGT
ncbi:fibronectin type III domain-containing protein [Arthrobacter sp. Cr_A7]|uniref:fibronectin type III domain-containing protein n=1 Tax=Arthrobacter sp. Cr_A7 TaxID=3031017 RepID=UPI0023DBCDEF|nr:fibronectin type III domain-containing protein [Arthrobacter sp. Cr_A7]MDF2049294.1 fibronectin type III domain-containing protein [Arthrobacter sp. Cr_A7]